MKLRFSLVAIFMVGVIVLYALYRKDDVTAAFKTPIIEFSIHAQAKSAK